MDKQLIEEIAKELCPHYADGNCYYEFTEVCECCCSCEFCWAVSQVLNAGYRKIPKGAVVLTREEHQRYLAYKIIEPQIRGCLDREEKLEKQVRELDKELNLAKSVLSYDDEIPLEKWAEHLRKETAEKFAEMAKEGAFVSFMGEPIIRASKIDEICKEITGEHNEKV